MKYIDDNELLKNNREFLNQVTIEVNDFFINFIDRTDRTSRWAHHYFCEVEGARLIYNYKTPHSHICSVCGTEYSNELFDGCWVTMYRNQGVTNAWKSALLYKATGEKKYLRYLIDFANFYNENYLDFKLHNKEGLEFDNLDDALWGCSRIMPQALNESIFIIRLINALELVKDDLSSEFLNSLHHGIFFEAFKMFKPQVDKIHNIPTWINSAIGVMGHFNNDKDMLEFTYNGEFNIEQQLLKGVTADNFWYEGSIHYNYFLLEGVVNLLLFSKLYNYDFKVGREIVEKMLIAGYEYAFDSHLLPNPNDGWPDVNLKTYSYIYSIAAKIYGEDYKIGKLLGSILNKEGDRGTIPLSKPYYFNNDISLEEYLFAQNVRVKNNEILKSGSVNFKSSYCGLIKKDNSNVFLKYGHNGPSHAHPDKMNVEVMLDGVIISRDLSNSGYGNPLCNEWQRKSPSHNTVVVNGESHTSFDGGDVILDSEYKLIAQSNSVYDGVNFVRDIQLEEKSFIDNFSVKLDKKSICDYFFHIEGELLSDLALLESDLDYKSLGYQHLYNLKRVVTELDEIKIKWLIHDKEFYSLINLENCELFICDSPDNSELGFRKTIILRQNTDCAQFNIRWEYK